jgi:Spy/CpxP family protein refolding chaperone
MKLRQTLIAATAMCALAASGVALAQPMDGHHHGMEGMEILHALNLTDAQKSQVHETEHAAWNQAKPIMAEMHAVHEQMAAALTVAGPVTADQLAPMMQKEEQLQSQLDQIHVNAIVAVRNLLTPEQVAQAASLHQKLAALHDQEHEILGHED